MLDILYRDDQLIAIDKPAGLLVHRSDIDRHETRFAVQLLRDQIGRRVQPVHRLDKGTSGVLLFAFDAEVAREMGRQFEGGEVDKTYLAVVRGWPAESGVIDHALTRKHDDYGRKLPAATAQQALTHYRRRATIELPVAIDRYPNSRYALVELKPLTGRYHQLRRHLKHISHPIIGDATHGKGLHNRFFQREFGCHRLLLACIGMIFRHPVNGARIAIDGNLLRHRAKVGAGGMKCPVAGTAGTAPDQFVALLDRFDWSQAIAPCPAA
ncbi:MAG: pseudouridylate synthase [Gammaproteobacteria bacterium]|nr:pseudouridylate synthase [Rhodocyclaceae bacterium]MBU3909785.1 pseudouridylate synthase [Gammaproteobacteria bacterium]MBU3990653.1 pseudouridylate synthase [Gammaproteobacteria bacterium]MBU4005318.1 pseudouridylate synthase [Gammaproteobacteria bacterium]MBU4022496.1 pseudouridylate synthase [Gammaproteobacteria bacterium]